MVIVKEENKIFKKSGIPPEVKFVLDDILKATSGKVIKNKKPIFAEGVSTDTRSIKKGDLFIAIRGDNFEGHDFLIEADKKGASGLIVENYSSKKLPKNISIPVISVKNSVKALGDLAEFHRKRFNIPVIAITGSNGKTTTKEMIWSILKTKYNVLKNIGTENNHIGIPKTLLNLEVSHEIAVLELGMNHPGEIENLARIAKPSVGVITNIGPSHLEFLGNLDNVLKAKAELLKHLKKDSILILNGDDKLLKGIKKKSPCKVVTFGIDCDCDFKADSIKNHGSNVDFTINKDRNINFKIPGIHNVYNALAAIAATSIFQIDFDSINKAFADFRLPPKRMNLINCGDITIIDDTYNSNPLSVNGAVTTLMHFNTDGKKIVIFGDMLELGKVSEKLHSEIGKVIAASGIDALIAVGPLSRITYESAKKEGMNNVFNCNAKEDALKILKELVKPKDILLFKGSRRMKMEDIIDCFITSCIR